MQFHLELSLSLFLLHRCVYICVCVCVSGSREWVARRAGAGHTPLLKRPLFIVREVEIETRTTELHRRTRPERGVLTTYSRLKSILLLETSRLEAFDLVFRVVDDV